MRVTSYTIGQHFVSAIINGDFSGLSDAEEHDLLSFLAQVETVGHWATTDESDEFGECEITGMRGPVETLNYVEMGETE